MEIYNLDYVSHGRLAVNCMNIMYVHVQGIGASHKVPSNKRLSKKKIYLRIF